MVAITAVVLMLSVAAATLVPLASDDSDAVGETHDVSNAAELALVGTGISGPDSITWDPDDNYVQTADIVFGPSDDFNMGYDIRVECISAVLSSPGHADLTFT
ncbi:MAG: hypothetical protein LBT41_02400, partial [Candidatus Methanoplasma sp.]|nr:hypothetical protein [Candidatus Methanoplasma sp.]